MNVGAQTAEGGAGWQRTPVLPAKAGFVAGKMKGLRKAAVLMVALGDEHAKPLFQAMSPQYVRRLSEEIAQVGEVQPEELALVLTEFYGLLETRQFSVRGGSEYAMKLMIEAFGEKKAEEMMAQQRRERERSAGDMGVLQKMEPQQLSKFLENENPQTVALVLANLEVKRGAETLTHLPQELRVEAVKRLAVMKQFAPEMAQKVALVLHKRMEGLAQSGRQNFSGYKSSADLLNGLGQDASRLILDRIEDSDPEMAIGIRNLMFTFDDLLTVPPQSIREFVGAADKKVLAKALKGARDNVRAHLFSAMSSRAVEMMKDDMEAMGPVRNKDVQKAQQELLVMARRLEAEGKMILKMEAEDERMG